MRTKRSALFLILALSQFLLSAGAIGQTNEPIVRGINRYSVVGLNVFDIVFERGGRRTVLARQFTEGRGYSTAISVGKWPFTDYVPIAVPDGFLVESISRDSAGVLWAIDGQANVQTWKPERAWKRAALSGVNRIAHTSNGSTFAADGAGVVRGEPEAAAWTRVSTDGANGQVTASGPSVAVLYDSGNEMYVNRSQDFGASWTRSSAFPIPISVGRGIQSSLSAVDASGNVFVRHFETGKLFVLRSGARAWEETANSITTLLRGLVYAQPDGNAYSICTSGGSDAICRFDSSRNAWSSIQQVSFESGGEADMRRLFVESDNSIHIASGEGLFRKADSAPHFIPYFSLLLGGHGSDHFIDFTSDDGLIVMRQTGAAHISYDGGKSWENVLSKIPDASWWYGGRIAGDRILGIVRRPSNGRNFGTRELVESADRGQTWQPIASTAASNQSLSSILYFDLSGQFVVSVTGGNARYRSSASGPIVEISISCPNPFNFFRESAVAISDGKVWCAQDDKLRSYDLATQVTMDKKYDGKDYSGFLSLISVAQSGVFLVRRKSGLTPGEKLSFRSVVGTNTMEELSAPTSGVLFTRGKSFYASVFDEVGRKSSFVMSPDEGKTWPALPDVVMPTSAFLDRMPRPSTDGNWWRDDTSLYRFSAPKRTGAIVEYQNTKDFPLSPGGQYFYTGDAGEQAFVDSGGAGNFVRTGRTIATGGSRLTCRMYGSVSPGPNSHFYSADPGECDAVRLSEQFPRPSNVQQWNYEGAGFFVVPKTDAGMCSAGSEPVYRAYNRAFDTSGKNPWNSNHRYSTRREDIASVVATYGWKDEGIAFCSPTQ
jgi:hypothetical protein